MAVSQWVRRCSQRHGRMSVLALVLAIAGAVMWAGQPLWAYYARFGGGLAHQRHAVEVDGHPPPIPWHTLPSLDACARILDATAATAATAGAGSSATDSGDSLLTRADGTIPLSTRVRERLPYCGRAPLSGRTGCALWHYRDRIQVPAMREDRLWTRCRAGLHPETGESRDAVGATAAPAVAAAAAAATGVTAATAASDGKSLPAAATTPAAAVGGAGAGAAAGAKVPRSCGSVLGPRRQRWVVFEVVDEFGRNGGLADRQYGVLMAFLLATVLDRAFGMRYVHPVPLSAGLQPVHLGTQWRAYASGDEPVTKLATVVSGGSGDSAAAAAAADGVPPSAALEPDQYLLPWRDDHWLPADLQIPKDQPPGRVRVAEARATAADDDGERTYKLYDLVGVHAPLREIENDHHDVIVIRGNTNFFDKFAAANSYFAEKWAHMGFAPGTNLDTAYACLFQALFAPSLPVQRLLVEQGLVLPTHQVAAYSAAHSPRVGVQPPAVPPVLACAQLRIGSAPRRITSGAAAVTADGQAHFHDSRWFNDIQTLGVVWRALQHFVNSQLPGAFPHADDATAQLVTAAAALAYSEGADGGDAELQRASVAESVALFRRDKSAAAPYALFVCSDSDDVIERARTVWTGDKEAGDVGEDDGGRSFRIIPGPIVHLDRVTGADGARPGVTEDKPSGNAVSRAVDGAADGAAGDEREHVLAGFHKAVADNYALGLCARAVISDSGFGRTGVWRTRIPHDRVDVLVDGQLQPFDKYLFNK